MSDADKSSRPEPDSGVLDRLLRIFGDVRAGEAVTVLLMLVNVLLLMVGYYILKTVREPLILTGGGAEVKSYAAAGQAVLLMGFVPLYSWFASRVNRVWLISGVSLFFMICLELFFLGSLFQVKYLGVAFFIWLGIYVLAILSQFWAYANDLYTRDAGSRLFPLIAIGATAGGPVGSKVASLLFKGGVSVPVMLQIPVLILIIHIILTWIINARQSREDHRPEEEIAEPLTGSNGFMLVFRNRYILLIAGLLILLNLVNTTGEYILSSAVVAKAKAAVAANPALSRKAYIGAFYGDFYFYVNLAGVILQALIVSRIVKYVGLAGVLFLLPIVAFGAYGAIAYGVGFVALRWVKTAENATDYSVMNTGKAMVWLPTSREEKYKAKQAVDTFFVRAGDLISAGLVFAGTAWLGFTIRSFAVVNLVLIVAWIVVTLLVLRAYRRLTDEPR